MRVLIVSKKHIIRDTLSRFVFDLGHEVAAFPPNAGISRDMERNLDGVNLIIFHLPGGKAHELGLMAEMHRRLPWAPILAITPLESILPAAEAVAGGVHAYLREPLSLAELELLISRFSHRGEA